MFFGEFENVDNAKGVHSVLLSVAALRSRQLRDAPGLVPQSTARHFLHGETRQCYRTEADHHGLDVITDSIYVI